MADISVKVQPLTSWPERAVVSLRFGSEGAASLAASTPAGGTVVATAIAWANGRGGFGAGAFGAVGFGYGPGVGGFGAGMFGFGEFGFNGAPPLVLRRHYSPDDVDAALPVGVDVSDPAGNASAVLEEILQLADAPDGPRNPAIAATANINEAALSWTASRHIS